MSSIDADNPIRDGNPLKTETLTGDGQRTLVVIGDLDMTAYEEFCQALLDEADLATAESLCLDLTRVDYIDARTWLLIVQTHRQLASQGRPFSITMEAGRQPERVYKILGLDRIVPQV